MPDIARLLVTLPAAPFFTFERVVGVLLVNLMRSLQVELDQFFSRISLPLGRRAHDDAFRMARKKLRWQAFVELNQAVLADLHPSPDWHGLRVVACDGTTLYLPTTHPDTISSGPDGFNCYHSQGGIYSLARASALCETSSGLILHASLAADTRDERSMLAEQFEHLRPDDLLVLDRGYPAYWLFALLLARQQHFCIRLPQSFSPQVQAFVASGQACAVIRMQPGHGQRQDFVQHQLPMDAFSVRLVRVPLKTGQIEILATSLLDASRWPAADFAALYQQRWRIEEAFRHLKCRLQLEQFGGETPQAIRQEFHASILLHNLAHHCCAGCVGGTGAGCGQAGTKPDSCHTSGAFVSAAVAGRTRHQSTGLGRPCLLELLGRSANDGLASQRRHVSQTGRNHAVTGLINDGRVMRDGYFRGSAWL